MTSRTWPIREPPLGSRCGHTTIPDATVSYSYNATAERSRLGGRSGTSGSSRSRGAAELFGIDVSDRSQKKLSSLSIYIPTARREAASTFFATEALHLEGARDEADSRAVGDAPRLFELKI
jgi:hypothetical protein